jgi:hypothetical protein
VAALLASTTDMARADPPNVIKQDNTGFRCEYFPSSQLHIIVSIYYDALTGEGYSTTEVLNPAGEFELATGSINDVVLSDGVVSVSYPLYNPDGSAAGEVILEGTYAASAKPTTERTQFPYAPNGRTITTVTTTPLDVTWTTFQVGDYDVSGITCEGVHIESTTLVTQPN